MTTYMYAGSTEDVDNPPYLWEMKIYCSICGTLIELDTPSEGSVLERLDLELRGSKFQRKSDSVLYCPAKTVEERYFSRKHPWAWVSLYRLIVKDYENGDRQQCQYRLSGIAQLDGILQNPSFAVPRYRNAAVLGWRWTQLRTGSIESVFLAEDLQATSYYKGPWQSRRPQRYGYPVHARCWSLIERLIGPEVEMHLATFVETLRRRFRKRIDDPPYHTEQDGYFGFDPSLDNIWTDKTRYLYRDPLRIPEVERLLKNAVITKKTPARLPLADRSGGEEMITKQYNTRQSSRRLLALGRSPFGAVNLPLDIQYLILDHLDHYDITVLHAAFAGRFEWRVSDSYWLQRAPRTLIYEIQDLLKSIKDNKSTNVDIEIDWEYLCLQAEKLVQTSEQLKNRRRIMRILEGTKNLFYQMMDKN